MGKIGLTRIALVITLSLTVTAIAVSSNKPEARNDVSGSIESIQVETLGSILQREHNERIRIAKEEAIRIEQARIAEEVRLAEEAKKAEEARIAEEVRIAEVQRQEELKKQAEAKVVVAQAQAPTETVSRGGDVRQVTFELTFYTSIPYHNGGYGLMANGKEVATATRALASNYYKMGTQINLTGYGTYTIQDRGGSSFNSSTRLDVLVPRKSGESDSQYINRVMNMGRVKVIGYVKY